jgi:glyoxylase-like metal-dependent hydrolase (beta-lactamase superfamily II)
MYVISCGKLWLEKSGLVGGDMAGGSERVYIPVPVFLFDHPEGRVLFDTACDPEGMSKNWPEMNKQVSPLIAGADEHLPARLKQLGISPEDIKYVVMSHLHTDHAGCLKLFKKAEVFVSDIELMQALKQLALREYKPAYIESDIKGWLASELNWRLVGSEVKEYELLPGLTIVNFGAGHTFGMLGLLAELPKSGNFLIVADALYTKDNLGPPVKLAGLVHDEEGYIHTAEFIREYAEKHNAAILFGHDSAQFELLVKSTEGYYE